MYDNAEEMVKGQEQPNEQNVRLATVTGLFDDGCAKIQFYGEDTESEKEYSYLSSYHPTTGDRVLLAKTSNSFVILGKINTKVEPEPKLNETLIRVIVNELLPTEDEYNTIIDNRLTANKVVTKGQYGQIAISSGNFYSDFSNLRTAGSFSHTGNKLGFYGNTPKSKSSVATLPTTAELADVRTRLNTLITALQGYGLV